MGHTIRDQMRLWVVFSGIAFAGQSIQLSTQTVSTSVPGPTAGTQWRVEHSIHDWPAGISSGFGVASWDSNTFVAYVYATGSDSINIQLYDQTDNANVCNATLTGLPYNFITYRFQHDGIGQVDYCQIWDMNGNLVWNTSATFTTDSPYPYNGVTLAGFGSSGSLSHAYFRIYNAIVLTNARPPVTADTRTSCLNYLKFDNSNNTGTLNDFCSAGPYNASMSSGSPTYVNTPGQTLVVAYALSCLMGTCPAWAASNPPGYGVPWRAGFPGQLDGTQSYSQTDASPSVSYFWQCPACTRQPFWSSHTSATPTLTGLIFGEYPIQLVATDVAGNTGTTIVHVGAVATDSNGVVVNSNPLVDALFGPMVALGRNPWGYQDYWALRATYLRNQDYAHTLTGQNQVFPGWTTNGGKPQWETPGQGTVSFYFNCAGNPSFCNQSGTTLNGAITATSSTVVVNNASQIDTSTLPTRIIVYDGTNWDELRVCSAAGNTLTLCYDPSALPRHSFANGTNVLQAKVTGSGTKFLTDSNSPVCPVGAPGLPGLSSYSAGTVTLTAGSTNMTGTGTSWTSANGVIAGDFVQVSAANMSGATFTFMAQIASVNSATGITLSRAFPSDADTTGGLTYHIMPATRTIVLHYQNQFTDPTYDPTGDSLQIFGTTGCESETGAYLNPLAAGLGNSFATGHDIPGLDGTHQTSKLYSVTDTTGWVNEGSTGGINFYGEDLAHWALYYRSGLNLAQTTAQSISNYWIRSPWANADGNGYPRLFLGGGGVAAWASYLTDPNTNVSISNLRGYANMGVGMVNGFATNGCNSWDDTRDSGWAYSWLILAAIYDPDTTSTSAPGGVAWRIYWQNQLAQMETNDTNCQRTDHSWSNGFYWNSNLPAVSLTSGSTAGTGTALTASMCNGTATGTATVTNGSATVTVTAGSIPNGTTALVFYGTMNSLPFSSSYAIGGSGSSATLAVFWPGDSGTVNWMSTAQVPDVTNNSTGSLSQQIVFGTSNNDLADLAVNYACIYNSSSSFTLSAPWYGATGSSYHPYGANLAGYGQQPFMLGIKALGMNFLAKQTQASLSSYASSYTTFTQQAIQWIHDNGYDANTQGTFYGRVFGFCEPNAPINASATLGFRQSGCSFGNTPVTIVQSREQNSEIGTAVALYYDYNQTAANRNWSDTVYGSLWGYCPWTTGGVYCDSNSPAANPGLSNLPDSYVHGGKWTGFFAGAGMSHRWPADRFGGVQPPVRRPISIAFFSGAITGATAAQIVVTAPSGGQTTYACPSSPCQVTVDDRQGTHLYQILYMSASGHVLSQTDPALLQ